MGYSAKAIANYFLELGKKEKKPITPLKIQKLVYIAHGWHLGITGEPLVADEYPEAWQFGPVFPSLYHEFKHFRGSPIQEPAQELILTEPVESWDWDWDRLDSRTPEIDKEDAELRQFLEQIWRTYGEHSGSKLSSMSHGKGTPWNETRKREGDIINATIRNEDIREFYKKKVEDRIGKK